MFNNLFHKKLSVEILTQDLKDIYCLAYLIIEKEYAVIELKAPNNITDLKVVYARLKNGHLIILINGIVNSFHSNTYDPFTSYRFYETLYFTNYFDDKYSKVSCRIPLLSNWFNKKYYKFTNDINSTSFIIQNEKEFTIKYEEYDINLYHEARFSLGQSINIKPLTYLFIKSEILLTRNELFDRLNSAKQFYQSFIFMRFKSYNLTFRHDDHKVISHSKKYPFCENISTDEEDMIWFSFNEIGQSLEKLFHNWMKNKVENLTIEDLFTDAFTNSASINRFLSAMRILEILSKRIDEQNISSALKQWTESINNEQILKSEKRKFTQSWLLRPFIMYDHILSTITNREVLKIIDNRNYYTHRNYKTKYILEAELLQILTNKVLGISKALFFLQIGVDEKLVKRVLNSFKSNYFFYEPIDNEDSTFYRKKN